MSDSDYEKRDAEIVDALRPKLTDDFLETLAQAVRSCGWTVDHYESAEFVEWCFREAEKEPPSLEPFLP